MKKLMNTTRLMAVAVCLATWPACSDNEAGEDRFEGRTPVIVSGSSIQGLSRATDNVWEAGDAIGLTLFEGGTTTLVEGNPIAGKYITATGNGTFAVADKDNMVYYPTQGKKADIVAFYPYTSMNADLDVPVVVADQTQLSAIDLMVADKVVDKNAVDAEVALQFRHKLVKVVFTIDKEDVSKDIDLSQAKVSVGGAPTQAVWNLADAALTVNASSVAAIDLPVTYDAANDVLKGTAILLPGSAEGVSFLVQAGGHTFEVPFTASMALKAGTQNTLRIHLKQTRAEVEAAVIDWTTGVTADLDNLLITLTGTPDTPQGDEPAFSRLQIWLADDVVRNFSTADSGAPLGSSSHAYTKANDGTWASVNPIWVDDLTATSTLYGMAVNTDANDNDITDAVTGMKDYLVTDATAVKGGVAAFEFRHAFAQLTLRLASGTGFNPSLANASITTPSMDKSADMITDADGNLHYVARGTENVAYTVASNDAHLVVPQTLAAGAEFSVTLSNGNTYKASMTDAVVLEAGKNTVVTLTLMPTGVSLTTTVKAWTSAAAGTEVALDNITTGGISVTAAEGDKLTVRYESGAATADALHTASYTYTSGDWVTDAAPLYWDDIAQTGFTGKFTALYVPAAQTVPDADYYTALVENVAYGSAPVFELNHALAKFTFTFTGGMGISDIATEVPTRKVTWKQNTATPAVATDGTPIFTLGANVELDITAAEMFITPQTLTAENVIVLTRSNGNKYTLKLTDLSDGSSQPLFGAESKIESGKHYTIAITVNETAVSVSATIKDWTPVSGSGTMTPDFN